MIYNYFKSPNYYNFFYKIFNFIMEINLLFNFFIHFKIQNSNKFYFIYYLSTNDFNYFKLYNLYILHFYYISINNNFHFICHLFPKKLN